MWDLDTIKRMNNEAVAKVTLRQQHAKVAYAAKEWEEAYSLINQGGSVPEQRLALAVRNLRKEEDEEIVGLLMPHGHKEEEVETS